MLSVSVVLCHCISWHCQHNGSLVICRSYAITVVHAKNELMESKNRNPNKQQLRLTIANDQKNYLTSETESNVVYVMKSNAKKVKVELESLAYLDKRFKMVPIANETNLIAIPITDDCMSYMQSRAGFDQPGYSFEDLVVNIGTHHVPLSSSSLGRLKQRLIT